MGGNFHKMIKSKGWTNNGWLIWKQALPRASSLWRTSILNKIQMIRNSVFNSGHAKPTTLVTENRWQDQWLIIAQEKNASVIDWPYQVLEVFVGADSSQLAVWLAIRIETSYDVRRDALPEVLFSPLDHVARVGRHRDHLQSRKWRWRIEDVDRSL